MTPFLSPPHPTLEQKFQTFYLIGASERDFGAKNIFTGESIMVELVQSKNFDQEDTLFV